MLIPPYDYHHICLNKLSHKPEYYYKNKKQYGKAVDTWLVYEVLWLHFKLWRTT